MKISLLSKQVFLLLPLFLVATFNIELAHADFSKKTQEFQTRNMPSYQGQPIVKGANQHKDSSTFHVLSYNVLHLPWIAAILHYKEDFRAQGQADVINEMAEQLDVVVIQEGFNDAAKNYLFEKTKKSFPFNTELVGSHCDKKTFWDSTSGNCSNNIFAFNGGVKIMSKHKILEKHQYIFDNSATGTADSFANKGAAYVVIEKDGRKYHVVGTHLQADQGSFDGTKTRNAQMTEISRWIDTLPIPKNEPLIFAGDMNVEYTNQSAFHEMKRILDADTSYTYDPSLATYSSVSNTIVKSRYPDYNDTLDYILISNRHKQAMNSSPIEVLRFQKENIDLSDHHAVLAKYIFSMND